MTELATIDAFGKGTPGSQVQFTYRDPVQMINISLASTMPKNVACSLNKVAVYKEYSTFTKLQIIKLRWAQKNSKDSFPVLWHKIHGTCQENHGMHAHMHTQR